MIKFFRLKISSSSFFLITVLFRKKPYYIQITAKKKDFKVILQNEYQIKSKLAKESTEKDREEDLQLINIYIESSVSAYIKLGKDLNECISCSDTRTNNYPCHCCDFLTYAVLELFHKPNLWQCIGQGNRSIVLLEKGVTYFN